MIRTAPRLWWLIMGISLVIAACYYWVEIPAFWSWLLAGTAVLLVGIPHGAADHQLFSALYRTRFGRLATWRFYLGYLGAIALVGVGWWLVPHFTLIVFIGLSAFHFGQSNFHYLDQQLRFTQVLSFVWGLWIVLTPIYLDWTSAVPILEGLWGAPLGQQAFAWVQIAWYASTLSLVLLGVALKGALTWIEWGKECLVIAVLLFLFYSTPLLVGFGLFFALWHALPSAGDQIRFFRQARRSYRWSHYLWAILPFAAMALCAILALGWWLGANANLANWWSLIFGAIAALTLPHMLLLDRVYHRLQNSFDAK